MSRTAVFLLVVCVLSAGCAGLPVDTPGSSSPTATSPGATTTAAGPVTPVAVPEPPAQPDRDSVRSFARERERAAVVNDRLGPSVADVDAACHARFDRWVDGDFYAVARCGGSTTTVVDGDEAVDSFRAPPAVYRVDTASVQRIPLDDVRTVADPFRAAGRNASEVDRARGLAVVNFDDAPTSVTVTVVHEATDEVAFNGTLRVDALEDRSVKDVTLADGRYRVVVRVADGTTARSTWTVRESENPGTYGFAIYVTSAGGVTLGTVD